MSLAPIHRYIGRVIHLMRKEKGMRQSELALLTGLKQPNLSRIENGLVSPRQVTLEKIAKALGVEVQTFYSESKVQEVERKWAASLGPKHAALMMADKVATVPLFNTNEGYQVQLDQAGEPQGRLEAMMHLPRAEGDAGGSHYFALRVHGDSMQSDSGKESFRPGEIIVFASGLEVKPGDYAFVLFNDSGTFRKVNMPDQDTVQLAALNAGHPERTVKRSDIREMWKLVQHIRKW